MSKLPRLIRSTREKLKISQADLARRAKVSPGYLSRIERGEREQLSEGLVTRLARALGYSKTLLLLSAGRLPRDVHRFLVRNPDEVAEVQRRMVLRKAA